MMMLTVWDGIVPLANSTLLMDAYKDFSTRLPDGLLQTFLLEDVANPTHWRILLIWASKEELERVQKSGVPLAVDVFRAAGSEPVLEVYNISLSQQRSQF